MQLKSGEEPRYKTLSFLEKPAGGSIGSGEKLRLDARISGDGRDGRGDWLVIVEITPTLRSFAALAAVSKSLYAV